MNSSLSSNRLDVSISPIKILRVLHLPVLFVLSASLSETFLAILFEFHDSPFFGSMAAVAGSSLCIVSRSRSFHQNRQATPVMSTLKLVSLPTQRRSFPSVRLQPVPLRYRVSCAAKSETVEKVCEIVRKQLALPADSAVTGESKFSQLGADSLDTVEIVMGLEEAFGINVEEDSAQSIATVQDAADLIEELVEKKDC